MYYRNNKTDVVGCLFMIIICAGLMMINPSLPVFFIILYILKNER